MDDSAASPMHELAGPPVSLSQRLPHCIRLTITGKRSAPFSVRR
jgi:hypothetical protein